ncbi:hypothetical protein Pcinc_038251 [Petrolisthes cinctipes]|uniref:Lipase domain-containing protein n=1 Tax=Petrolisthes cinctipes TaxID=88211 RepID=A0AAE1BRG2_PETCI|nr:hypothetical protein Pcinc_038251 [Petrolisthes cinctipes]
MSSLALGGAMYALLSLVPRALVTHTFGDDRLTTGHQGAREASDRTSPLDTRNDTDSLTTRCYGVYGCFNLDQPFLSLARPVNVFPLPPSVIAPDLCLYTRSNPTHCQRLLVEEPRSILGTNFRPRSEVKILTHGYLEHGQKRWLKSMMSEYLRYDDLNVVVLDWLAGSGPPYTQAVANIRLIGAMLGYFLLGIQAAGVDLKRVHVVGHSLGAQMAGYTGHYLSLHGATLGRITGLDPAEPYFEGTDPVVSLDPGDATLVDVIHTDAGPIITGGLGIQLPAGRLDFYPNGGVTMPGCGAHLVESVAKEQGNIPYGIRRFIGCNHIRSYEYFTESINTKCPFLGIECLSWDAYWKGNCWQCKNENDSTGSSCAMMGAHANIPYIPTNTNTNTTHQHRQLQLLQQMSLRLENSGGTKLFLITGSDSPFCSFHHRVSVVMSYTPPARQHGGDIGIFYITLVGRVSSRRIQLNPEEIFFEPGNVYTYMIGTEDLGHLKSAKLEWSYVTAYYNPLTWRLLSTPAVYVNRIHINSIEMQERYEFCGMDQAFQSGWVRHLEWQPVCPQQAPPPGASFLGTIINFDVEDTITNNIDAVNSGLNSLGNGQLINNLASSANQAARELMEDAKRRVGGVSWPNRRLWSLTKSKLGRKWVSWGGAMGWRGRGRGRRRGITSSHRVGKRRHTTRVL